MVLTMLKDSFFAEKRMLIIDKSAKQENDKTWSFWEKGESPYESIVRKSWQGGWFHSTHHSISLQMDGYKYKTIKSLDFYNHARQELSSESRIDWIQDEVIHIGADGVVKTSQEEFSADIIFDSSIPNEFHSDNNSVNLSQHFLGWVLKFEDEEFKEDEFTMMDFRDRMPGTCSFMYVLPFDKRTALVEFTFFSEDILQKEDYEEYIRSYLDKYHSNKKYSILEKEYGVIPMSTFDFSKYHSGKIVKIGTGGGWVKPSSGYSFKITQRFIREVINNIKKGRPASRKVAVGKHRFYDSIFLGILKDHNDRGEALFETMYKKLPASQIFRFLDEETTLWQDIKVMSKFANAEFTKAFLRRVFS